ncbi:MAG: acetolactate synthase 3 large subunit [Pseudomonadales bacterium]|nr:acetolactate synthase 3 large subunit [Pseudomonadales bacterium]MDP4765455.1 acetolactate synthase 3 large subunit [Pseudomonadales bacterium]MDP4875140.1 acetolactate synthase 3 large subunit [Pseudomonadales bacterium]MDP4910843.1 acetolactate synthase 3 large subunit [Pseudomonadales bacterium]MDP5058466.1 acetolactate synthase 3 large subunit [Pseudomonadales bacterium]
MEMLSGGDILIRCLQEEGVDYVFGYPGGAVLHIYDALFRQNRIRHILVRHEQAATHMADGYARSTGRPGVVLVTSGPGATNAITGIATAYMDSIPMVVISGQVQSHLIGTDSFQETDMIGICRPIVKHSFAVRSAADLALAVKKAFYIATSGRPGPVVIDIPKDITNPTDLVEYEYPQQISLRSYNPAAKGHTGQIKKAVTLLMEAERPMIYAGGGVIQGNGASELTSLTRLLGYPIVNTLMGLGAYPGTDKQFLGMLGMHGTYEANMAMHHCDVLIAVGARFDDRVTNTVAKFCPYAKIIHIDIDPASISKNVMVDVPIVGPVESVLTEMLEVSQAKIGKRTKTQASRLAEWWAQIEGWRKQDSLRVTPSADGITIKPQEAVQAVFRASKGAAYVTTDVGQHQMFAALYYPFDEPRKWINSGGLGTMGFGLPAAMGVQMAFPDALVCCITGEGSIQMNIQELSTCAQYGLPIKIININNRSLGMVKQWQDMQYEGRHSDSYMESLPDFVKLAEAYGHVGIKVERLADLDAALEQAFALQDRLVFVDVIVDRDEHVYPMHVAPNGSMRDMWLKKGVRT